MGGYNSVRNSMEHADELASLNVIGFTWQP